MGRASLRLSVAKVLLSLRAGFTAVRRALGVQNFPFTPLLPSRSTFPVEPLPPSYLPPRVPALRRGLVRQRHRARASGDGSGLLETDAKRSPTEEEEEEEAELRQGGGAFSPRASLRSALQGRGARAAGGRWRGPPQLLPQLSPAQSEPNPDPSAQRSAPNPRTGYLARRWGAPPFHRRVRQTRCARVLGGRKLGLPATVKSCSARRTGLFGSSPDPRATPTRWLQRCCW